MIKKIIILLIMFVMFNAKALAQTQSGAINTDVQKYDFLPGEDIKFKKSAEHNLKMAQNSIEAEKKVFYLRESMRYYFMYSQIRPDNIDAYIGLGRVYDELNFDKYAKKNFYFAYNLNKNNPFLNYFFGEYYYKRNDLLNALSYYTSAYNRGLSSDFALNKRLAEIYEKIADIETAKTFYSKASKINPKDSDLKNKIRLLDELNYSQTQYYLFEGKKGIR